MPITQTDALFGLIKSLNKSEKRNFKLFANRLSSHEELKFIQLFVILDKMKVYDETLIFNKIKRLNKLQLTNLKRHLYSQILKSLRMIHSQKHPEIEIREQLDYAQILYDRGLFIQSLRLLERIKPLTTVTNQHILYLEILEFEKLIEARHITRSRKVKNKMENLIQESTKVNQTASQMSLLSNLMLKIQGFYINFGFVKNDKDVILIKDYFQSNLPNYSISELNFSSQINLNLSYLWYHYILLEFDLCADYGIRCIRLFDSEPVMIEKDPDLYMRMLHYTLTSLYYKEDKIQFNEFYKKLDAFYKRKHNGFNTTSKLLYYSYGLNAKMNYSLLHHDFQKCLLLIPEIKKEIEKFDDYVDPHRHIIYYYKIAWIYFIQDKLSFALDYITKIVRDKNNYLRDDLYLYARLMQLLIHFELGHDALVGSLMLSIQRQAQLLNDNNQIINLILNYIRLTIKDPSKDNLENASIMQNKLTKLRVDRFEKRVFIYFDFVFWAQKKVNKLNV